MIIAYNNKMALKDKVHLIIFILSFPYFFYQEHIKPKKKDG